jgi:hypothetical protein
MRKEIITREKSVTAANVKIIPIARVSLVCLNIKGSVSFHAFKQPEYILIYRDGEPQVFRITGERVSISRAVSECPALTDLCDFQLPSDS